MGNRATGRPSTNAVTPSPAFYNEPALRLADLLTAHSAFQYAVVCTGSGLAPMRSTTSSLANLSLDTDADQCARCAAAGVRRSTQR